MVLGKRAKAIQYCRGQIEASGQCGIRALLRAGQIELGQGALFLSLTSIPPPAVNWFAAGRGRGHHPRRGAGERGRGRAGRSGQGTTGGTTTPRGYRVYTPPLKNWTGFQLVVSFGNG